MISTNLRSLRHFVAVAEELHFGRAAARLYMTQPPLSQSIQALEQELGLTLFNRTNRSVSLTPIGALWLPHVRQILDETEALPQVAKRLARGEIGTLRLSFVSTTVYGVLPEIVSGFSAAYPDVEITLQEATSNIQVQTLLNNDIDAGLVIAPTHRDFPPGLDYHPISSDPLIIALPQKWLDEKGKIGDTETIKLRDMAHLPLILFPRESSPALHDLITGYYVDLGIEPLLGQQAIQMQTMIGLVSAGMGFALVPDSMRTLQRTGVVYKALTGDSPMMETGLVLHARNAPPSAHNLLQLAIQIREGIANAS
jgi:DNA-binding transcriptional LysR family regulator